MDEGHSGFLHNRTKSVLSKLGFVISSLPSFVNSWSHIEMATIEKFGFVKATWSTEVLSVAEIGV